MTKPQPHLRIDNSITQIVEAATRALISETLESMAVILAAAEEEGAEVELGKSLPPFTPDILRDWLSDGVTRPEDGTTYLEEAHIECVIGQKVASLYAAQLSIDLAMQDFFKRCAVHVAKNALFIDVPQVVEALGHDGVWDGCVALVPIENFYETSPTDDGRVDVVMGVVRWEGLYLCRPALASLEALGDKLATATPIKVPTVSYEPSAGIH